MARFCASAGGLQADFETRNWRKNTLQNANSTRWEMRQGMSYFRYLLVNADTAECLQTTSDFAALS